MGKGNVGRFDRPRDKYSWLASNFLLAFENISVLLRFFFHGRSRSNKVLFLFLETPTDPVLSFVHLDQSPIGMTMAVSFLLNSKLVEIIRKFKFLVKV